jgi:hypothetical protein
MNARRFIRSSSQLEVTGAEYQVSMVVALSGANVASQARRVAHARFGSKAVISKAGNDFRSSPTTDMWRLRREVRFVPTTEVLVGLLATCFLASG